MLLAVVIYGGFVFYSGFQSLKVALLGFYWPALFAALGLSFFNYLLRFGKWQFYLSRLGVRGVQRLDSFLIFLSGFVLTITPGKVGEVFKSAVLHETHGVDPVRTAPIILAERLTDVIAIVVLIAVGSLGFSGGALWALLGAVAVAVGVLLIAWPVPLLRLISWVETKPGLKKWAPQLRVAHTSLLVVASPAALFYPTFLSIVGWGAEGFSLWLLLQGFQQTTPVFLAVFFYATATLAGALVPVPGGLGVAEGIMQSQLLNLGGVALGAATASMLLIRFSTLWFAVIVGFVALWLLKLKYPKLLSPKLSAGTKSAVR